MANNSGSATNRSNRFVEWHFSDTNPQAQDKPWLFEESELEIKVVRTTLQCRKDVTYWRASNAEQVMTPSRGPERRCQRAKQRRPFGSQSCENDGHGGWVCWQRGGKIRHASLKGLHMGELKGASLETLVKAWSTLHNSMLRAINTGAEQCKRLQANAKSCVAMLRYGSSAIDFTDEVSKVLGGGRKIAQQVGGACHHDNNAGSNARWSC